MFGFIEFFTIQEAHFFFKQQRLPECLYWIITLQMFTLVLEIAVQVFPAPYVGVGSVTDSQECWCPAYVC